ncbi:MULTISPECIES: ABC transporter substrate-binding protein [unclassified Variovorax]|uniref:ABC transporter substrate-binding protein n=1 Tax=unclassified Variovorax TaxID=663243 RepID=UPI002574C8D7|nr:MULTISPECIES: ABC transporter substrate-binding protein [unclassified Variovorax]MDM0086715.1 ABC transporter substrate-binding protein [Variovorax sp. J22G40]MDM0145029.1 ABC transporter substrate-binding protein [Variovorax sp. J2P1-31]
MTSRRTFLTTGAALALAAQHPLLRAQGKEPIRIGILIPLTGATSQFGSTMSRAAQIAAEEINAAGGIHGRRVEVVIEDDQSNPEAAVRAARKLIDVDRVVAIGGSYASSVTSAIAPLCWESRTVLATSSGADSITKLPHQGYIFRTSPTVTLQGTRVGDFGVELGCKKMFFMGPQTPFAQSYIDILSGIFTRAGGTGAGLIYEDKKSSYRSEVDQALRTRPDVIVLGGYVPDTSVVLKDLYRAGYDGKRIGFSFGINQKLVEAVPAEVGEGAYSLVPSASVNAAAYKRLIAKMKVDALDSYSCQVYDHVNLVALALADAPAAAVNGTTVRDHLRGISQAAQGKVVDGVADALKLLGAGSPINFDGASGPLEFADNGDVKGVFFRYEQIQKGKLAVTKVA